MPCGMLHVFILHVFQSLQNIFIFHFLESMHGEAKLVITQTEFMC